MKSAMVYHCRTTSPILPVLKAILHQGLSPHKQRTYSVYCLILKNWVINCVKTPFYLHSTQLIRS